jgi:hypothetical protein
LQTDGKETKSTDAMSIAARRAVKLAPLEAALDAETAAAGGAIRSARQSARSARRKSPYGGGGGGGKSPAKKAPPPFSPSKFVPAGPPTTGLSAELEGMALGSVTRAKAKAMIETAFGASVMERQKEKEEKWKARLARDKATWWDAAALSVCNSTTAINHAVTRTATGAESIDRALKRASSSAEDSLLTLALGRNHARADMASVAEWKDAAMESFLGGKKAVAPAPAKASTTLEPVSPGHFERKYGRQRQPLPPIAGRPADAGAFQARRSRLASAASEAHQREASNQASREKAFMSR